MTTFDRIKKATQFRGSNLKKVAVDSGLSENAIYRYNQGIEPKYTTLKVIADTLHVSVDYLLGNTDEMMPNKKDSSDSESNDVKEFFKKHEVFSYDGKPISEKDLATIKFILENGYEDK